MAASSQSACLEVEAFLAYLQNRTDEANQARVEAHIATCGTCRATLSAMAMDSAISPTPSPQASASTPRLAMGEAPTELGSRQGAFVVPEVLDPGTIVGRFIVHRTLGAGGFGVVYAAHDPELDRTIALKILRRELADDEEARARFLREAQAMARLSHPNVISVYDVGADEGRAFIAMEYIEGHNFADWLATSDAPVPKVLAMLIEAGRGLAAAHTAGLIHRDFKPANLLVGGDGRVVVTDFGLARAALEAGPPDRPSTDSVPGRSPLAEPLTLTGSIQGTPAYMAPEQTQGQRADARADQFSFCVTLHEALFRSRPVVAGPGAESMQSAAPDLDPPLPPEAQGAARSKSQGRAVPPWLRRILQRGLSWEPDDRYPSMGDLLAALDREPARRRRRARLALAAAAVVVVLLGGGLFATRPVAEPAACAGAERKLADLWNPAARSAMGAAFAATGLPYAADSWRRVGPILDDYTRNWTAMYADACEATRVRREQSEALMDLRMVCLDSRRRELEQLARLLRAPDAVVVENAVEAAHALGSITACGDLDALTRPIQPPPDRAVARRATAIRNRLAEAQVLSDIGKYDDALALLRVLGGDGTAREYLPVRAEVSQQTGKVHLIKKEAQQALPHLQDALWAAEASRHDEIAVRALTNAASALADLDRVTEAEQMVRRGEAALVRFSAPPLDRAQYLQVVCFLHVRQGRIADARDACHEALDLRKRELGPTSPILADSIASLGVLAHGRGDFEKSMTHFRDAVRLREKALGPDHPSLVDELNRLGVAAYRLGQIEEAVGHYRRAIAIGERTFGPDSLRLEEALGNLGNALEQQTRHVEAGESLRRAIAIVEKNLGPDHSAAAKHHTNLGGVLDSQDDHAGALEQHRRAASILKATVGTDDPHYAIAVYNMCAAQYALERVRAALPSCTRGLAGMEKALGRDHPGVVQALVIVGSVYAANGRRRDAIAALERVIAAWSKKPPALHRAELAWAELALARELWSRSPRDRARARQLAQQARDRARRLEDDPTARQTSAEAAAWLRTHRGPRPHRARRARNPKPP